MRAYKYYLHTHKIYNSSEKNIIRNCTTEEAILNEHVDLPSITVDIDRMKQNLIRRPQNSKYDKYKEIMVDDFNLYLSISLDVFKTLKWGDEAEFYLNKPYTNGYEIVMFTNSKTNRYRIDLELDANIEYGRVGLIYSLSYTRRNQYRKNATPIDEELFEYILRGAIKYMEDDHNYGNNFNTILTLFQDSYEGKVKPVISKGEVDLSPLILSLNDQIKQVESRLMNNDTDRKGMREKLRGRLEGLKGAVNEIKGFERNLISS